MGIDPAPFWANLFLYKYEKSFVDKLISEMSTRAYLYGNTGCFIDYLCAINDREDFKNSHKNIYPDELELKLEHSGLHVGVGRSGLPDPFRGAEGQIFATRQPAPFSGRDFSKAGC